jgi:hypothetical protein
MDVKIEGVYRDTLNSDDEVVVDTGWRSNTIVADFGRFLATLMKRDFEKKVGIEYIAVGGGNGNDAKFKESVASFFASKEPKKPYKTDGRWAWAKKIDLSDMLYLNDDQTVTEEVTNRLRIDVAIEKAEPVKETLVYEEFALLGIDESDGEPDTNKMFFVDYVNHAPITKDESMKLTRTIVLTFPLGEGEGR